MIYFPHFKPNCSAQTLLPSREHCLIQTTNQKLHYFLFFIPCIFSLTSPPEIIIIRLVITEISIRLHSVNFLCQRFLFIKR